MRFQADIARLQGHPKFDEAVQAGLKFQELCHELGHKCAVKLDPNDLLVGLPMTTPLALAHFEQGYKQGRRDEREKAQAALAELLAKDDQ